MSPGLVSALAALVGMVLFGLQIVIAVIAATKWSAIKPYRRPAAVLAAVFVILTLPVNIMTALHLDPSALAGGMEIPAGAETFIRVAMQIGALVGLAFSALLVTTQLLVASLLGPPQPFPLLSGEPDARRGLELAAAGGMLAGFVSVAMFVSLGVTPGPAVDQAKQLLPGLDMETVGYQLGVALPAVIGVALSEELLFRGVFQRWLDTKLAALRGGTWVAIAATSALWASAHLTNVEEYALKLAQIFVIGLFFGHLTKRYSVEASMVAHVLLNVIAVLGGLALR